MTRVTVSDEDVKEQERVESLSPFEWALEAFYSFQTQSLIIDINHPDSVYVIPEEDGHEVYLAHELMDMFPDTASTALAIGRALTDYFSEEAHDGGVVVIDVKTSSVRFVPSGSDLIDRESASDWVRFMTKDEALDLSSDVLGMPAIYRLSRDGVAHPLTQRVHEHLALAESQSNAPSAPIP